MKKLISLSLVLFIVISFFTPVIGVANNYSPMTQALSPINLNTLPKAQGFDYDYLPASSIWKNIVSNDKPAQFKNVSYSLNDNVIKVSNAVVKNIKSAEQILTNSTIQSQKPMQIISEGGFINKGVLQSAVKTANIQPGTVFFDESSNTAFKLVTPIHGGEATKTFENNYSVTKPQIHEVVKDFNLPQQTVLLNKANITGFADAKIENSIVTPGIFSQMSTGSSNFNEFKYLKDPLIELMFPKDTELKGYLGDGQEITVKINGGLGIGDMKLDGSYSSFNGYKFALTMSQEAFLQVIVGINIKQEIRIPILGIEIPFGIGRVSGGLFLVVAIDGNISIELQTREWATCSVGVAGGTFLYVPTYVIPYFDMPDKGVTGDVFIDGKINGVIKAGALLSLELLGWELVGAGAFIGAGLIVESDGSMLDIELYGLIQAYIALLGDQYNLVDFKMTVFKRQQKDMGGYRVKINEACAYQDRVGGVIEYDYGQEGRKPEKDVKFKIRVTPAITGVPITYKPSFAEYYTTDEYGEFIAYDIPLALNDKVEILVTDKNDSSTRESGAVKPTFPFRNIYVNDADYFNDFVVGQVVPIKVRKWGVHTGVDEEEYETLYYEGLVTIRLLKKVGGQYFADQDVIVQTDSKGNFIANDELTTDGKALDVKPGHEYSSTIDKEGFLVTTRSTTKAKVQFVLKRVTEIIAGSEKKYTEGKKVIDQISINERYYIINMRGTKQLTADNIRYEVLGFSTQDKLSNHFMYWSPYGTSGEVRIAYNRAADSLNALYPVLKNLQLTPEIAQDGIPNGTSYLDNKVITEWVWQPHSNPTVITSDNQYACSLGGSTFQVTATGVVPIHYDIGNAPSGVTIDNNTGLMTVSKTVQAGKYPFTIIATAATTQYPPDMLFPFGEYPEYREDDSPPAKQDFTLTITQAATSAPSAASTLTPSQAPTSKPTPTPTPKATPKPSPTSMPAPTSTSTPTPTPTPAPTPAPTPVPTATPVSAAAPVIISSSYYDCTIAGSTFQVTATGKSPIRYSLSSTSPAMGIPEQIRINSETGLITIVRGLSTGTYKFNVNASNGIEPNAVQLFTLTLKPIITRLSLGLLVLNPLILNPLILNPLVLNPINFVAFSQPSQNKSGKAGNTNVYTNSTQNSIKLRNDDPKDKYSRDSLWVSGAEYIKWDGIITLNIEGVETELVFFDRSPSTDHHLNHLTSEQVDDVKNAFKELAKEHYKKDLGFDTSDGIHINPIDSFNESTILDYGSILKSIKDQKAGLVDILLDSSSGTLIPGKVFGGLKEKAGAKIAFNQLGAKITFASGDIRNVRDTELIDFAFSKTAPNANTMLQAAGNGGNSYTYSFAHNGKMPGFAEFSIATNIKEGTIVNVYKYEVEINNFSLIADNIKVGAKGMVNYKNNTTSEYIITTQTIAGALISEAYSHQDNKLNFLNQWSFWLITGGVLILLLITGAILVFIKRKKKRTEHPISL